MVDRAVLRRMKEQLKQAEEIGDRVAITFLRARIYFAEGGVERRSVSRITEYLVVAG
jgi:hypothetical protein